MTTETSESQVAITDDDGLPIIDLDTFSKWMDEALQHLPTAEAVAELLVMLRWYRELELKGIKNDKLPNELTFCERSIYCILELLKNNNYTQKYGGGIALMRLHSNFIDIANGKRASLFEPKERRSGKPPNDTIDEVIKGRAAGTLSQLIEARDKAGEAADRVAKALRKSRPDMRDVTGNKIINWRERLMEGEGAPGASETALKHYKDCSTADFGNTPRARGENLLKQLEKRGAFFG
jgi:hypothetical protein